MVRKWQSMEHPLSRAEMGFENCSVAINSECAETANPLNMVLGAITFFALEKCKCSVLYATVRKRCSSTVLYSVLTPLRTAAVRIGVSTELVRYGGDLPKPT